MLVIEAVQQKTTVVLREVLSLYAAEIESRRRQGHGRLYLKNYWAFGQHHRDCLEKSNPHQSIQASIVSIPPERISPSRYSFSSSAE